VGVSTLNLSHVRCVEEDTLERSGGQMMLIKAFGRSRVHIVAVFSASRSMLIHVLRARYEGFPSVFRRI
jgi:hypothetical protein